MREIMILKSAKDCPYLPRYFGTFKKDSQIWISMEYCEAGSLHSVMENLQQPLTEPQIAAVLQQTLQALLFLHRSKTIHRDIKAANVLLTARGEAKLADFGVSTRLERTLDKKRTAIGSPYWMAPELILEQPYDSSVDVWSLGVTAIELAEGRPPYYTHVPMSALFMIASDDNPPPGLKEAGDGKKGKWSEEFHHFLSLCLVREPSKRATAAQLLQHEFVTGVTNAKAILTELAESAMEAANVVQKQKKGKDFYALLDAEVQESASSNGTPSGTDSYSSSSASSVPTVHAQSVFDADDGFLPDFIGSLKAKLKSCCFAKLTTPDFVPTPQCSAPGGEPTDLMIDFLVLLVVLKMSHNLYGVTVQDHKRRLKTYPNSFIAKEAVDWLYTNLELESRQKAVYLANAIFNGNLILSLQGKKAFEDTDRHFYRFNYELIHQWDRIYQEEKAKRSQSISANDDDNHNNKHNHEAIGVADVPPPSPPSTLSASSPSSSVTDLLSSTGEMGMTARDWQLLLTGAKLVTFKKGEIILKEGDQNDSLYRVKSGRLRVEKAINASKNKADDEETSKLLTLLGPERIFGEMSVIRRLAGATATVRADVDSELHVIECEWMKKLFLTEPGLSKRVYYCVCLRLANRLRQLPLTSTSSFAEEMGDEITESGRVRAVRENEDEKETNDRKFRRRFGLTNQEEVVIKEYPCCMKRVIVYHGQLFISSQHLCFFSSVFGHRKSVVIPFRDIKAVEATSREIIISTNKKKSISFRPGPPSSVTKEAYSIIHELWSRLSPFSESNSSSSIQRKSSSQLGLKRMDSEYGEKEEGNILTKEDWDLLLGGFMGVRLETYHKDQVIMKEGHSYQRIFQIARGTCRIERQKTQQQPEESEKKKKKDNSNNGKESKVALLGKMRAGEMFGEISFLEQGTASASVIADENPVQLYVIEGYFLHVLFTRKPALAGRFYHHLASEMALRLTKREHRLYKRGGRRREEGEGRGRRIALDGDDQQSSHFL
ncbi:Serine/threonine-protein kinase 4 [Balamuthia mandrillaris]